MRFAMIGAGFVGLALAGVCVAADTSAGGSSGEPDGVPQELRPFFAGEEFQGRETSRSLGGGGFEIGALAVSSDGSTVVTCGKGGVCQAVDVQTRKPLGRYKRDDLKGDEFCVAVSGDGRLAAVGGEFQAVHVWDTRTGEHKFTHDAPQSAVVSVSISNDAKWMVCVTDNGSVYQFPLLGGRGNAYPLRPGVPGYDAFATTPDGTAAVGFRDGQLSLIYHFPQPDVNLTREEAMRGVRGTSSFRGPFTAAGASQNLVAWAGPSRRVTVMPISQEMPGKITWRRGEFGPAPAAALAITPDDGRLVAVTLAGEIDMMALPTRQRIRTIQLSGGKATAAAVSSDARLVALGYRDGHVALVTMAEIPDPPQVAFREAVLAARDRGDYALLERLAEWLGDGPEPFDWSLGVPKYEQLVGELLQSPLDWQQRSSGPALERWIEKHPDSTLARLALASHHIGTGWSARGSGFAGSVTEEGWREFTEYLGKAQSVLSEVEVSEATPPEYFRVAIVLAQGQGEAGGGRERFDDLVAQLMKLAPEYAPAHEAAAEYLLPRWHGEPGEIAEYADRVADQIGGAAGDAVYAQVAMKVARFGLAGVDHRESFLAHELDLDRVRRGLQSLRKLRPNDPAPLRDLVYCAYLQEDRPAARDLLKELTALTNPPVELWNKPVSLAAILAWAQSPEQNPDE